MKSEMNDSFASDSFSPSHQREGLTFNNLHFIFSSNSSHLNSALYNTDHLKAASQYRKITESLQTSSNVRPIHILL